LAAYSGRAITAIRAAEQQAGGFAHIAFFEPVILWPSPQTAFAPDFTTDENIVFAPHNYAESLTAFNTLTVEQGFALAAADAATYQSTFWIGEYGWAMLDLWIPQRGNGPPSISGAGLGTVHITAVPGGYRAFIPVSGSYRVAVVPG